MYLKFGNILAVSNVCSLPWSELKTGDHIILFERTSEPHQDEMQDRAVHMVLYRKQHERFFSFHCHSVHTVVEREYDLDTYEQTDEYGFIEKSDESERHYVILSDGKPYLLPTVKQDVRYNADLFRKVASQDLPNESDSLGRLVSHLYSGSRRVGYMHAEMSYYSCDLQSSGYVYLILPIANDIAVLLALRVEVYAGGYCLTRDIEFAILTTDNVYMATYDPGKEFLSDFTEAYLKSQSSGSFREENERNVSMFLDAVEVFYANSVSLRKENMLNQLERHLDRMVPYSSPMSVFKNPFYAAILAAEGEKQSAILRAEGEKEARIREAEGVKMAQELEAQGRAEAIRLVAEAEKDRIERLRTAGLDPNVLAYRSFEALEKLGEGNANTIFVPNSATDALAAVGTMFAAAKAGTPNTNGRQSKNSKQQNQ